MIKRPGCLAALLHGGQQVACCVDVTAVDRPTAALPGPVSERERRVDRAAVPAQAGREEPLVRRAHLPALGGSRGVAILVVLLLHTGHPPSGFLGVDLFLPLSGYLIADLLLRE